MNTSQIISHTIALLVVGCIVGFFQYRYLHTFLPFQKIEILRVALLFLSFFWIGWYLGGPPFDSLFGFTALGCSLWLVKGTKGLGFGSKILGLFSYFIGSIGGHLVAIAFSLSTGIDYTGAEVGLWQELWTHGIMWLMMAIPTAILGGYLSGIVLNRHLNHSKTQSGQETIVQETLAE